MSRRFAATLVAVATLIVAVAAWLLLRSSTRAEPITADTEAPAVAPSGTEVETTGVTLYFPGADRRLHPQAAELPLDGPLEDRAAAVVEALLAGPALDGLLPALPAGTRLLGIIRGHEGEVYVNLGAPEEPTALAVGSAQELAWAYSVVDTLALNLEEVRSVGILWSNRQPPTLSGHVDTTAPLLPDPDLVVSADTSPSG